VTEAVRTMASFCFQELGVDKVLIRCASTNKASRAVAERLGFVIEGVLREQFIWDNEAHDIVVYGMLRRDWTTMQVLANLP